MYSNQMVSLTPSFSRYNASLDVISVIHRLLVDLSVQHILRVHLFQNNFTAIYDVNAFSRLGELLASEVIVCISACSDSTFNIVYDGSTI